MAEKVTGQDEEQVQNKAIRLLDSKNKGGIKGFYRGSYGALARAGFYARAEKDMQIVGFSSQKLMLEDFQDWEVAIPRSLEKTWKTRIFGFGNKEK